MHEKDLIKKTSLNYIFIIGLIAGIYRLLRKINNYRLNLIRKSVILSRIRSAGN